VVKYQIDILSEDNKEIYLSTKTITAVFLIAFDGDKILSCRNDRGWDIPGGHVEPGETLEESLRREVREEVGASFGFAVPFATLTPEGSSRSMLFYATDSVSLGDFVPSDDALERGVLSPQDLLRRYHGDKDLLAKLIEQATLALKSMPNP
jgi:8-oxo-dGTP diphosphatase